MGFGAVSRGVLDQMDDRQREQFEERAAILEFCAGLPRPWAEEMSRILVREPPPSIPPARWLRFIRDAGRFVGQWRRLEALGLRPVDVFGQPEVNGLPWAVNGAAVTSLKADVVTVRTDNGSTAIIRRSDTAGQPATWRRHPLPHAEAGEYFLAGDQSTTTLDAGA